MPDGPGLTLVTVLFDLARRERSARPAATDYLERGHGILGANRDLVVFADPELATEIQRRRDAAGHAQRTTVVPVALEDLPAHGLLGEVAAAHARRPPLGWQPIKDTPLYVVLQWARLALIVQAIEQHVAGDGPVAMIDFGLAGRAHPGDDPFESAPERMRALMLRGFSATTLGERRRYYAGRPAELAAGFLTGGQDSWRRLSAWIDREIRNALDEGLLPTDEHLLAMACVHEPDLFDFHHGDYPDILLNAVHLRGSAANLSFQLQTSGTHRDDPGWIGPSAFELAGRIVGAVEAGLLKATGGELAGLLDECFVAAFHGGPGGRELAARARDLYFDAVRSDHHARDAFLRSEVRVRGNFAFLD